MSFDTIISNGTIVDGTNTPRYISDIGITNGIIETIGTLTDVEATNRIDASRLVISPGFIDMHSHSDITLLEYPGGESKAYQGVTTEVTGNCSYSPFPAGKGGPKALQDNLGKTLIGNVDWSWHTLDEWAESMNSNGISINVAPQVGQAAIQISAGATKDRRVNESEMKAMKHFAEESMEMGAFALSTGLSLAPSGYANTDEIVELCKSISGYEGAFYVTHARVGAGKHLTAIEEAIEIGHRANIPVQFSHMAIIDRRVYGDGPKMVELLIDAREQGLDITYDVYPYTAAGAGFNQTIPLWAQAGSIDELLNRLKDPETRAKILEEVRIGLGGLKPLWDTWYVAYIKSAQNKHLIGKNVEEIALERDVEPAEAVLQVMEEENGSVPTRVHNRHEEDVRYFLSHDLAMIGSDGRAISSTGSYKDALPHPRFYGTYPRILGRYVRETPSALSLENAIHKMTGFPAKRLGMKKRGIIKKGLIADLVLFDPSTIIDNSTCERHHRYTDGIPYVFVDGTLIVDKGRHTGARPGKVLRRGNS